MTVPLRVQLLRPDAIVPTRAHPTDAGVDLAVPDPVVVPAAGTGHVTVGLGFAVAIPAGWVGLIIPRSSTGTKLHLRWQNTVGVVDADYRGELMVAIQSDNPCDVHLEAGQRVGQLVVVPCLLGDVEVVDTLDTTVRGTAGFGSTGTH